MTDTRPVQASEPSASGSPAAGGTFPAPRTLRLAYLTNQYPAASHTFIRRELREVERLGNVIVRLSIRKADNPPIDQEDLDELGKTTVCLAQSPLRLATAAAATLLRHPRAFARAVALMLRMWRQSDRGIIVHTAYLVEACFLLGVLRRENVEHVHVHFGTNAATVMRLVRRLGGPTYSLMIHGAVEWDEPRQLGITGKIADALFVTAISHYTTGHVRRWANRSDWPKVHVVRCTIGDEYAQAHAPPIDPANRTLTCVGRLSSEKGQVLLVEAFAEAIRAGGPAIDGARLVLVGDGDMRGLVEERARTLGVADRLEITGWVPEVQVKRRLIDSRAFVLTSFIEGLPVVVMEAMALARPVLTTFIGAIPELVVSGESGWLVPAGDTAAIARAIREVLAAPADRLNAMGHAGRQAVLQRHNTRVEGATLDALFRRYLGGGR